MAKTRPKQGHAKLAPIPQGSKIQKRPLLRPQLSSSSSSPTVYISSHTPFMSAVKRVRKVLTKSLRTVGPAPKKASLQTRVEVLRRTINDGREDEGNDGNDTAGGSSSSRDARVAVTVVGTGKAVDKVLSVAAWFEQDGDCRVCLRTKTVKTVDDIVSRHRGHDDEDHDHEDAAESRVRRVSGLEAAIQLK